MYDYSKIIGTKVFGVVDRPMGSTRPNHPDMIYSINYGYVSGVFASDGEEYDAYILGCDVPHESYEGKVIAVYHRFNDVENKWIVSLDEREYTKFDIMN